MSIRPDLRDRCHTAYGAAGEVPPVAPMTIGAVFGVNFFSLRTERLVDSEGIFRRREVEEPFFDSCQSIEIDRGRKRAGAESGVLIAFLHLALVAVPMQLHVAITAGALQPNRRQIAETDDLSRLHFFERIIHEGFRGIKGISPARAPVRVPNR